MDVRAIFAELSERLFSEFRSAAHVKHSGGRGTLREDALGRFLCDYLPARYTIGRGEVISAQNAISGQLDAIIYDPLHCPILVRSAAHAVFPIESVFGAISIKSTLSSNELKDAYANIGSVKRLVDNSNFVATPTPGIQTGMGPALVVGVVVAYQAGRSLEAVASQAMQLDAELGGEIALRPDFIVVLGEGIVGPPRQIRSTSNSFRLPVTGPELVQIRQTGKHTLLRFYLQLLAELNALTLRDLDVGKYIRMPRRVGNHLVDRDRVVRHPAAADPRAGKVLRLTPDGVEKIIAYCKDRGFVTFEEHLKHKMFGAVQLGWGKSQLAARLFEHNPKDLPPMDASKVTRDASGHPVPPEGCFQPWYIQIDGESYGVDMFALGEGDLEEDPDVSVDELMSA